MLILKILILVYLIWKQIIWCNSKCWLYKYRLRHSFCKQIFFTHCPSIQFILTYIFIICAFFYIHHNDQYIHCWYYYNYLQYMLFRHYFSSMMKYVSTFEINSDFIPAIFSTGSYDNSGKDNQWIKSSLKFPYSFSFHILLITEPLFFTWRSLYFDFFNFKVFQTYLQWLYFLSLRCFSVNYKTLYKYSFDGPFFLFFFKYLNKTHKKYELI